MLKNSIKITVVLLLVVFAFSACKSKKETATAPVEARKDMLSELDEKIQGVWQLVRIDCCSRSMNTYEGTEMRYQQVITINKPNVTFEGDNYPEKRETTYFLSQDEDKSLVRINFGDEQFTYIRFEGKKMVLDMSYVDLQTEYYKKIK